MHSKKLSAREIALQHLQSALDTGVRGDLREAIRKAIDTGHGRRVTALTDVEYRNLAVGAQLVDPDRPGLLMKHGKRTGKQWVYRYEHPETRKQINMVFGRYPNIGVGDAREIYAGLRNQRQQGLVPTTSNDADAPFGPTMDELIRRFLSEYVRKVKAASSAREDERLLTRHVLPNFADLPAVQFDHLAAHKLIMALHGSGAPREAEKLRAVLATMFNVACNRTRKIGHSDPINGWLGNNDLPNPAAKVSLPARKADTHKPKPAEIRSYIRNMSKLGDYTDVFRTQIETCARIAEITGMRWNEIDFEDGTWTLPAARSKNGKEHSVMLARQTIDRLQDIKATSESEFVFPARTDNTRQLSTSLAIQTLGKKRTLLGVSDRFTSHSTRHAALTWVAENGGGRDIRDRLSNHTPPQNGADHIYVAAQHNSAAREWTQQWCDYLTSLESENVVSIGGVRA